MVHNEVPVSTSRLAASGNSSGGRDQEVNSTKAAAAVDRCSVRNKTAEKEPKGPSSSSSTPPTAAAAYGSKASRFLPEWVITNLRNPRSLKTLARCWLASWVCIILLLPTQSLQTLGQAAFFTCMVTVFLPANMPIFLFLFASATMVCGIGLGWAWGCAAMAIALRVRDTTLLQSQLQTVQSNVGSATNPESAYQAAIFQAAFLDGRSSAVYGVFLSLGSYIAAVMFTQSPKLRGAAIFMTIVLDVMCTYGPLFPIPQYTLGTIFLLPIGVSLGVSFACILFVFPETLSHTWQNNLIKLVGASKGYLKIQSDFLSELSSGSDLSSTIAAFDGRMNAARAGQLALLEALDGPKSFLHMELTYSPLSAKDLSSLVQPCRSLVLRFLGLGGFKVALQTVTSQSSQSEEEDSTSLDDLTRPIHVHHTHAMLHFRQKVAEAEKSHHVAFREDLLPVLVESSRDLLAKGSGALDAVIAWLEYTNVNRWRGQSSELHAEHVRKLRIGIDEVEDSLRLFDAEERHKLLAPYEQHFKASEVTGEMLLTPQGAMSFRLGSRALFLSLLWSSNAIASARQIIVLAQTCYALALKRPESSLWMPSALSRVGHAMCSKKEGDISQEWPTDASHLHQENSHQDPDEEEGGREEDHMGDGSQTTTRVGSSDIESATGIDYSRSRLEKQRVEEKRRLRRLALADPDALPGTKWYNAFGRFLSTCHAFAWSPRGVFALRFTIGGIVAWIPSVATQQSAAFSYSQRALWAIIMAQLSMAMTHGDFIFSVGSRMIGTVAGAMLGAALWYVSSGSSNGNPYGFGAMTAVVFVPLVFFRLFAPMQLLMLGIMTFVTFILTIGYSWIDGNLAVTVSSGLGISVAWRRMLTVLVGVAIAAIIMVIPRPTSTRRAVRLALARLSQRNLALYSNLVEAWATQSISVEKAEHKEAGKSGPQSPQTDELVGSFRSQLLTAFEAHKAVAAQIPLARLDIQLRGQWPGARYEQLLKAQGNMISALAQLCAVISDKDYDHTWRRRFAHSTALLDPSTVTDVSLLLSLLSQSLQTGSRLPHATFLVRERAIRHQENAIHIENQLREIGSPHATPPLTLDILRSVAFMKHVQGAMALQIFLVNLDESAAIVRALVGEVPLHGYEALRDRWDDRAALLRS